MTKLERVERSILIFLIAALVLGVTVSVLRKSHQGTGVIIDRFDPERYKETAADASSQAGEKININNASAEELAKIKGIGRTIAERIVEYRYQNGSFASIDDIKDVKGVGVALFEKIRNRITTE
jgi:competence ComEA-like helix-hairpin-helix protein